MSFGKENVGEFTTANISYFSEPGIWLGKILADGVHFARFAKVFPTKILCYTVIRPTSLKTTQAFHLLLDFGEN